MLPSSTFAKHRRVIIQMNHSTAEALPFRCWNATLAPTLPTAEGKTSPGEILRYWNNQMVLCGWEKTAYIFPSGWQTVILGSVICILNRAQQQSGWAISDHPLFYLLYWGAMGSTVPNDGLRRGTKPLPSANTMSPMKLPLNPAQFHGWY